MKTLSEYNAYWTEKRKTPIQRGYDYLNIACDHCGQELAGSHILMLSSPPQQDIYCPGCGWQGRRYVYER
jgi:ribosomal protein S27E